MKNSKYWEDRALLIENDNYNNTMYHAAKVKEQYELANERIQKEINKFYEDFAINNQIGLAEARRILNSNELKEFKTTLKQYQKMIENDINGELTEKILNISIKQRITRLQALQDKIDIILSQLENNNEIEIDNTFHEALENAYYQNIYGIENYNGIHTDFTLLNTKTADDILKYNWSGVTYSDRIWRNQIELRQKLKDGLNKNFIQGNSIAQVAAEISKALDTDYKNAVRLMRTEVNYINNKASIEAYKEKEIKQYEFVAVLDLKTSEICADMDGEIINIDDLVVGVNCPPLHPNCRSTVIPHIEGVERNRVARNPETGEIEEVGNLTYKEWYAKYVDKEQGILEKIIDKNKRAKLQDITNRKDKIIDEAFKNDNIKKIAKNTKISSIKLGGDNSYHRRGSIVLKNKYTNRTVIHEIGHAVDYNNKWLSSSKEFINAIETDKTIILKNTDKYVKLIKDNKNYAGLSDIIGGMTANKVVGRYKHKKSYWKQPNKLQRETFAQLFTMAGEDDFEQLEVIQKYLPNTFKAFDKLIGRIL